MIWASLLDASEHGGELHVGGLPLLSALGRTVPQLAEVAACPPAPRAAGADQYFSAGLSGFHPIRLHRPRFNAAVTCSGHKAIGVTTRSLVLPHWRTVGDSL